MNVGQLVTFLDGSIERVHILMIDIVDALNQLHVVTTEVVEEMLLVLIHLHVAKKGLHGLPPPTTHHPQSATNPSSA